MTLMAVVSDERGSDISGRPLYHGAYGNVSGSPGSPTVETDELNPYTRFALTQ